MVTGRSERGFTLLEVLVALAVLATAMGALIKGSVENAAAASYLRDKSYASWVAQNVVTELQLNKQWSSQIKYQGSEEMGGAEWLWKIKLSKTFDENIQQIEVEVWHEQRNGEPLMTLVAFLVKPTS